MIRANRQSISISSNIYVPPHCKCLIVSPLFHISDTNVFLRRFEYCSSQGGEQSCCLIHSHAKNV